jgi:hypothetical protein
MKERIIQFFSFWIAVQASWFCGAKPALAGITNTPPAVTIIRPPPPEQTQSSGMIMKIKAEASDPDGTIERVEFFVLTALTTNLIGVATNPPYNVLWAFGFEPPYFGPWSLKAVAVDNSGARTESQPSTVSVSCILCPPSGFVDIISPVEGAVFVAPAKFTFAAEVLVSSGGAGPLDFLVGANSVGVAGEDEPLMADTAPTSITVSNLAEGEYQLAVLYLGVNGGGSELRTIRVVKLAVQSPRVNASGQFEFEVLTSFPGRPTIIQASSDLVEWTSIHTNEPSGNSFWFTEFPRATNAHRFYRAWVPPE